MWKERSYEMMTNITKLGEDCQERRANTNTKRQNEINGRLFQSRWSYFTCHFKQRVIA